MAKKRGKYKKRSKEKQRQIVAKALEMTVNGKNISQIAQSLNLPRTTLRELLKDDQLFAEYQKKQQQVLNTEFSKLALRSAKQARKKIKQARYKDLVVGSAIAYDKAYPNAGQQINIGDNRSVNIKFSRWKNAPSWGNNDNVQEGTIEDK